jgi:hypothetical protein
MTAGVSAIGGGPARLVAPERTSVGVADLEAAIRRAYIRVTGSAPTSDVLRSLSAQASVETAAGQSMYNFNFGGIKGAGPHGLSASCVTHEVVGGTEVTVRQSFRAYASLDDGAEDYVRVLLTRFGGALPSARSGDLTGFAHALKQAGYYTASEQDYAAALTRASAALPPSGVTCTSPSAAAGGFPSDVEISRLVDALSASALRIADPDSDADDGFASSRPLVRSF